MTTAEIALSPTMRRRALATIVAVAAPIGVGLGMLAPLCALALDRAGYSELTIGVNAAATPLGVLLAAPFAPRLARRFGAVAVMAGGVALTACAIFAMTIAVDATLWFILRLLIGLGAAAPWAISETLVNALADDRNRARWVAAYGSCFLIGMVFGPIALETVGVDGPGGFWLAVAVVGLAASALASLRGAALPAEDAPATGAARAVALAPTLIAAGFASGYLESAGVNFFSLSLVSAGRPEAVALYALAALLAGGLVAQWPTTATAKRVGARSMAGALGLAAAGIAAAFPLYAAGGWVWVAGPLFGAAIFGLYVAGLIGLGLRFTGGELAAANAAFIMAYMLGGLAGPALIGAAATEIGAVDAFAIGMAIPGLALAGLASARAFAIVRPRPDHMESARREGEDA